MDWPLDLPIEFLHCKIAKTPDELLNTLVKHPDDHVVDFFLWITDDLVWSGQNIEFLKPIFHWLTIEFLKKKVTEENARNIAKKIRDNYQTLLRSVFLDLIFEVEGQKIPANSLMYGAISSEFISLIRQKLPEKIPPSTHINELLQITLKGIPYTIFSLINEYVNTGKVEHLSQMKENETYELERQAQAWKIHELAKMCGRGHKKYINKENVAHMLTTAHQEYLPELQLEVFSFIENWDIGITLSASKSRFGNLSLEIHRITENGLEIISSLSQYITELHYHGKSLPKEELFPLLRKLPKINVVDFSKSSKVISEAFELLPNIEELDLSNCPWINSKAIYFAVTASPNILRLNLSDNEIIDGLIFTLVGKLKNLLVLNLNNCRETQYETLFPIIKKIPKLRELYLSNIQSLRNNVIHNLMLIGSNVTTLDLSECHRITEDGFANLVKAHPNFISLICRRCRGITDNAIVQIVRGSPDLKLLDVRDCNITSKSTIEDLQKRFPYVKILY